jgi:quercetin dioxygenase-like cupin family protein
METGALDEVNLIVLGGDATRRSEAAARSYRVSMRQPEVGEQPLRVRGTGKLQPLLDSVLGSNHVVAALSGQDSLSSWHTHDSDQVLVIASGQALLETADERHLMQAGSVAFVPAGCVHRHGTPSTEGATTVYLTATGHGTAVAPNPIDK